MGSPASTREPQRARGAEQGSAPRTAGPARVAGGGVALALIAGFVAADGALRAPWCSTVLVSALALGLGAEVALLAGRGCRPLKAAAAGAGILLGARLVGLVPGESGEAWAARGLFAAFALLLAGEALRAAPERGGARIAAAATALLFVFAFGYLLDLLWLGGVALTAWVVLAAKASDMGGWMFGKWIGGPRLAPRVSPNKTWAGAFGGLLLTAVVVWIGGERLALGLSPGGAALFAVSLFVAALAGDLGASVLKRYAGVKDSGRLVPTFGGILDLVDSLVLAAPVGYSFLLWREVLGPP